MKKNKIFLSVLFVFVLTFSFSFSSNNVFAKKGNELTVKSDEIIVDLNDEKKLLTKRIGLNNYIKIKVDPSVTGVNFTVKNYGIDTVDSVTVQIKSNGLHKKTGVRDGYSKPKYTNLVFKNIRAFKEQKKKAMIPMVTTKMTYSSDIAIKDGKKVVYKKSYSNLLFTDKVLSVDWLKGGSPSLKKSVDYHFAKHHNDKYVKATNIKQYLDKANYAREIMKDKKTTTRYFKVTNGSNSRKIIRRNIPKEYILINKSSKKLYSYGGN